MTTLTPTAMNLNNILKRFSLPFSAAIIAVAFSCFAANAQTHLPEDEAQFVVKSIAKSYSDWSRVEINGKLDMQALPIRPSVKIYMEKGKSMLMSLRAPLIGEVGRLEIFGDTITIINRHNNVYCQESISNIMRVLPGDISVIQDIFLQRIFLLGKGTLRERMSDDVSLYSFEDGGLMLLPNEQPDSLGFNYGFEMLPDGVLSQFVVTANDGSMAAVINYQPKDNGVIISTVVARENREINVSLDCEHPRWGATPPDRFEPTARYRLVSIQDFMKSLM